jgi:predicted glycosyltransferase
MLNMRRTSRKIWIDLDNSPHVLFFDPIISELEKLDIKVIVTARDYAQVIELAELFGLKYQKVGRNLGKNTIIKGFSLILRSIQLLPVILRERPLLALSHGSRTQIIVAKLLRIKSVMAYDYELAKGLPFFKPQIKFLPEAIPDNKIRKNADLILKYPGLKEDVYVYKFHPEPTIISQLQIDEHNVIITIRPPATKAHYYVKESGTLFTQVLNYLSSLDNTQIIITPRTEDQGQELKKHWEKYFQTNKIIIPNKVVNGLNLIWNSDIVISGGGTMIREAAALGVPAYSIFQSEIGSVDKYLVNEGRLVLIGSLEDVLQKIKIVKRHKQNDFTATNSRTLKFIVDNVVKLLS